MNPFYDPGDAMMNSSINKTLAGCMFAVWCSVLLIAGAVASAAAGPQENVSAPLDEISVEQTKAKMEAGALILDVREPSEWYPAHIPGSKLIPLGELEKRVNELPRDKHIVVVCRSGGRSAKGRDILKQAGFTGVTSMAGGMNAWRAAGYPTVSGQ
jgi:rhodanese-related sulfurtransferase